MPTPSAALRESDLRRSDYRACLAMIQQGSKSFYTASLILPQSVRTPAYALYAFCRLSDDAVDDRGAPIDAVDRLAERLDRVYAGKPDNHPADRAFAHTVEHYGMPRALPDALLDGLLWDTKGRRYATLSELYDYSARVAGSVGAMMTVLMGSRDEETLARACDLGVAMQLTNISRDIGEDARNGRIYLPMDWLEHAGIDPEAWLADPQPNNAIRGLTSRLLDVADTLYDRAMPGIARLPLSCRPAIHAARIIYREIGRCIAQDNFDSVTKRAVVSRKRKFSLLASALAQSAIGGSRGSQPCLDETAFLVHAVHPVTSVPELGTGLPADWWDVDNQVARVLTLFERLEARDRSIVDGREPAQ